MAIINELPSIVGGNNESNDDIVIASPIISISVENGNEFLRGMYIHATSTNSSNCVSLYCPYAYTMGDNDAIWYIAYINNTDMSVDDYIRFKVKVSRSFSVASGGNQRFCLGTNRVYSSTAYAMPSNSSTTVCYFASAGAIITKATEFYVDYLKQSSSAYKIRAYDESMSLLNTISGSAGSACIAMHTGYSIR